MRDFHFAQVDCAAQGDLCHQNNVKYYPSIFLYVDGEFFQEYTGSRDPDDLAKYVDDNLPAKPSWAEEELEEGEDEDEREEGSAIQTSPPEPSASAKVDSSRMVVQVADPAKKTTPARAASQQNDGLVHAASVTDMALLKQDDGPAGFVKFFAPWCGHCKTLAPRWVELASQLKDVVNLYEVDCEEGGGKRVCRDEGVKAYPTIKL